MKSGAASEDKPRKRPTKAAAGPAVGKVDRKRRDEPRKEGRLGPAQRRELARYLSEDVTVVLTEVERPPGPKGEVVTRRMPATTIHYASSGERMALSEGVAKALIGLEGGTTGEGQPDDSLDDGADWRATFLAMSFAALLKSAGTLIECEDLQSLGSNTLSSVGNIVSDAIRRALLLWVLDENHWNMTTVGQVLRLGTASHVLRAIKDLGLESELDDARKKGLVKRGAPKKTAPIDKK
jgi:hypothetical protein